MSQNSAQPASEVWQQLHSIPFSRALFRVWAEIESVAGGQRWLAQNDRYYLLVHLLRRKDALHPWVFARCREVESAPDGYIDIWARGHYKSTIITFAGIIQELLRDPELTVGIFSHTSPTAKAFLAQIKREFESNADLKGLFPDLLYADPAKESESWSLDAGIILKRRSNPKEASIEAHGLVDGQPTAKHFRLMVYDDVVTDKSVYTPEQIVRTTEAWELSDNLGAMSARKWIIGTRYHYADTYSEIIKRGAAKSRIYPATHDGTLDGQPILFTPTEWARRKRDQGEATVACQLLANPLAGHQRIFNVEDLQVYEVRPSFLMGYLLVDPARSIKKESDETAMVILGIDTAGNKYLLDGVCHKMDLMDRWRWMRDLRDRWLQEPGMVGLRVGYESFGAQSDLQYFQERQKLENNGFEITELAWPRSGEVSKVDRVQRLGPDIRSHRFYVPYATDPKQLTKTQRQMLAAGLDYRIAVRILKLDENREKYDLTEKFRIQLSFFPFGGLKDLPDAVSRIYDMEPSPPADYDRGSLEPEIVA